jgi:uncharacterized protein YkwD
MRVSITLTLSGLGLIALAGCGGGAGSENPTAPSPPPTSTASALTYCVSRTNDLRATLGRAALSRSSALEAYATSAAESDGRNHTPHRYFDQTRGGNGTASAENLIPWWSLGRHGSVLAVMQTGIAAFFGEGPGGGHYRNMTSTHYRSVGCGVFVNGDEVTIVQAFK